MDVRLSGKLTRDGLLDNILRDPSPPESNGHDATALFIQFVKGLKSRDARPFDHCYRGPQFDTAEWDHVAVNATFFIYKNPQGDTERGDPLERQWATEYVADSRIDEAVSRGTFARSPSGPTGTTPLCQQCQQVTWMNGLRGQVLGVFGVDAPGPGPCCREAKSTSPKKKAGVSKRTKKPKTSDAGKRETKLKSRQSSTSTLGVEADETENDYFGPSAKNEPGVLAGIMNLPPAGDPLPSLGVEPTGVGSQALADEPWEGAVENEGAGMGSVGDTGLFDDDDWLRVKG